MTTSRKKIIVVMPAYNAEKTLERTYHSLPPGSNSMVILVDDHSQDQTVSKAKSLGIDLIIEHDSTKGYGGNQKTCYKEALKNGADIVVMIHPDYQYDARLLHLFVGYVEAGVCDVILGNRIRTRKDALLGGMPKYKYFANRFLTLVANICLGTNLGDFHSGFRIYSRHVLETIPYQNNSDDFSFDPELLAQAAFFGFRIGDAPIPCRYFADSSSINFTGSLVYGIKTLLVLGRYLLAFLGCRFAIFSKRP